MHDSLRQAIVVFLDRLEAVQAELAALMAEKRIALTEVKGEALRRLSADEAVLTSRLQELLGKRRKILEFAQQNNLPSESLLHMVKVIGGEDLDNLVARIERAQVRATELRHESWVHWIISHRSYNHYTELLDLIADCGQQSPVYYDGENTSRTGGAMLDASI